MIHIVTTNQLPIAIQNGCNIILISADSTSAMIRGTNIDNLEIIESYQDSELNSLYSDPFWKQPCTNCENV